MSQQKPGDTVSGRHLELETFLPYRLSVLTNRISNAIARDYHARFGLSVAEWRAMAVLGRFGPASATDICARTAMDKVTVSRAAKTLVARRFVSRRTDTGDRRKAIYALTKTGQDTHDRIVPIALGHESRLLSALNANEIAQLDRLLEKLQRRASENPS